MSKLIQELRGYKEIKDLVEGELSEYNYFQIGELNWNDNYGEFEEDDKHEHYQIEISNNNEKVKTLYFNYDKEKKLIEIELGEDSWHKVCDYNYTIKYFWMALLEW